MGTLTETSIFNDKEKPAAISIWADNHLTNGIPVCTNPRTFDFVQIGNTNDSRWYAYENLIHPDNVNDSVILSRKGWMLVDLGMWAPPAYIWADGPEGVEMIALPAWDGEAAKTLGIEYEEWAKIMQKHAVSVLNSIR